MKKTLLICFLFCLVFYGCKKKEADLHVQNNATIKVKTEKIKKVLMPEFITFNGFVSSDKIAFISPKIDGYIKNFNVSPGETVKKGDLLFTVANQEIAEKVGTIKAKLASLYTVRKEIKILYDVSVKELKQAKANFNLAEKNYRRYKNLLKSESVTKFEFDKIRTEFLNAETEVEKAKNMLQVNNLKIVQNKHDIESLKKKLAVMETMSGYRFVKAPFDGIVLEKYVDNGNLVSPGIKVLKIGSLKKVAYFTIPAQYKTRINEESSLFVKNKPVKVLEIYPDILRNTSQFKIKTSLPQEEKTFTNGEYLTAKFKIKNKKAILIDKKSVKHYSNVFFTYLCVDGYVVKNFITVKKLSNDKYQVLTGLNEGDQLIINPLGNISENMRCSVN